MRVQEILRMYKKYFKRILDIMFSFVLIIVLIPLYFVLSMIVLISMGRPILFSQDRIGKNEKFFRLYKFRTMKNTKDKEENLLDEEKRLTKLGRFLRSSSLDELPELWSIFIGKMSFVGPRPLPTYYSPYFFENEKKRHTVKGGLIPPDSLSKKAYTTWEEQFEYEINYADNISLWLDIKVVYMTFAVLYKRITSDYGSNFDRMHLNIYRSEMKNEDIDCNNL